MGKGAMSISQWHRGSMFWLPLSLLVCVLLAVCAQAERYFPGATVEVHWMGKWRVAEVVRTNPSTGWVQVRMVIHGVEIRPILPPARVRPAKDTQRPTAGRSSHRFGLRASGKDEVKPTVTVNWEGTRRLGVRDLPQGPVKCDPDPCPWHKDRPQQPITVAVQSMQLSEPSSSAPVLQAITWAGPYAVIRVRRPNDGVVLEPIDVRSGRSSGFYRVPDTWKMGPVAPDARTFLLEIPPSVDRKVPLVELWNVLGGSPQMVARWACAEVRGEKSWIPEIIRSAFQSDSLLVIHTKRGIDAEFTWWDIAGDPKPIQILAENQDPLGLIHGVAFSCGGRYAAVLTESGVFVFDGHSRKWLGRCTEGWYGRAAFSHDGRYLAAATADAVFVADLTDPEQSVHVGFPRNYGGCADTWWVDDEHIIVDTGRSFILVNRRLRAVLWMYDYNLNDARIGRVPHLGVFVGVNQAGTLKAWPIPHSAVREALRELVKSEAWALRPGARVELRLGAGLKDDQRDAALAALRAMLQRRGFVLVDSGARTTVEVTVVTRGTERIRYVEEETRFGSPLFGRAEEPFGEREQEVDVPRYAVRLQVRTGNRVVYSRDYPIILPFRFERREGETLKEAIERIQRDTVLSTIQDLIDLPARVLAYPDTGYFGRTRLTADGFQEVARYGVLRH